MTTIFVGYDEFLDGEGAAPIVFQSLEEAVTAGFDVIEEYKLVRRSTVAHSIELYSEEVKD